MTAPGRGVRPGRIGMPGTPSGGIKRLEIYGKNG